MFILYLLIRLSLYLVILPFKLIVLMCKLALLPCSLFMCGLTGNTLKGRRNAKRAKKIARDNAFNKLVWTLRICDHMK